MKDWIAKLHGFLTLNDRNILTHAGKISHLLAKERAEAEYETFNQKRIEAADAAEGEFEKAIKQLPPPKRKGRRKK
ncbi:MAG TPA: RhuM family protein [Verrucomicrobiae bacterium]